MPYMEQHPLDPWPCDPAHKGPFPNGYFIRSVFRLTRDRKEMTYLLKNGMGVQRQGVPMVKPLMVVVCIGVDSALEHDA